MNRLELKEKIIEEGKTRGIIVTDCKIYDRKEYLEFCITIVNNTARGWVYKHEVQNLIDDLAPIERYHKISNINLDNSRYEIFHVGDDVEINDIWIKVDEGEKEPKEMKVFLVCGPYRSGWMKGKVFETPGENNRVLGIKFNRDIWLLTKDVGIYNLDELKRLIKSGDMREIKMGQPVWIGTHNWSIRKA